MVDKPLSPARTRVQNMILEGMLVLGIGNFSVLLEDGV
jgi:hypothetical protein